MMEQTYPKLNITQKTIDEILSHPKFFRGHVRTLMGKIYTTDQFEKRSDSILGKKLP